MVDGPCRRSLKSAFFMPVDLTMKAKNLEDVVVYHEAIDAADAVSTLLERPAFRKDFDLWDQLSRSSSRIGPLIAEGFGQLTDRHLATYLGRARGSALETRGHLRKAAGKSFITWSEASTMDARYVTIGKRLTRWIQHLRRSDWKDRG
jgi:four helix bundle protein